MNMKVIGIIGIDISNQQKIKIKIKKKFIKVASHP
jgi:hypothetical protein